MEKEFKRLHFKEWTLNEFDAESIPFTKNALENKKWAFVADYFRVWVLYTYGGIYLDCDVEVRSSFDWILQNRFVASFEDWEFLGPHFLAANGGNRILNDIANNYRKLKYDNNNLNSLIMPKIITKVMALDYGLITNGKCQTLPEGIEIYSPNYFTLDAGDGKNCAIHHMRGSWNTGAHSEISWKNIYLKRYFSHVLAEDLGIGQEKIEIVEVVQKVMKSRLIRVTILLVIEFVLGNLPWTF